MKFLTSPAIALMALVACNTAHAQGLSVSDVRAELEAMLASDQIYRGEHRRTVAEKFGRNSAEMAAVVEKQNAIDEANIRRLTEIVEANGWPKQSVVGGKAGAAAFLVLQHAGLEVQKRFLPHLQQAVKDGEAAPQNLALLQDRILVREGKPQIYGSQLTVAPLTGKHTFSVIEDEANVDKRRASVGLPPLAEYAKRFGFEYEPPQQ